MDDLAAWLLEQIAADEEVARGGVDQTYPGVESSRLHNQLRTGVFRQPGPVIITRSRVLAECAAKRAIVELADRDDSWRYGMHAEAIGEVLRLLAQPYRDRPGWRQEWAL